ncbi:D-glycero-beta-D-manno-heptose 1,7-bisphosphate 7-phosphatase [Porticoccaceae bacterium LTM1]|nr:D-glycero-beta-D-manno-heptose 1,7-bisphosphate 7-phosphatase [Porticoccaceae bacterium LTM1]
MTKLIILDRDGVINEDSDAYVKSVEEWIPLPGSIEAIARLSQAGYQIAIATNQSGLGRGYFQPADLEAMHNKLLSLLSGAGGELAGIFFCPHAPEDNCQCRKPLPGLVDDIEQTLGVSVIDAPIVGDSLRDLEAGVARGCKPILVRTGKGEKSEAKLKAHSDPRISNAPVFDDLAAVADYLLAN